MPKYVVVEGFKDLQDKNKIYKAGEQYPTPANKKVSQKRIAELTSKNNRQNKILIQEVKEEKKTEGK